ncbi:MAG TPA: hypothetical protein PKJ33_00765 [Alphaproteobacteria bacterium]|nr:hypothetical protein [Alphaproteobacteria bacterium]
MKNCLIVFLIIISFSSRSYGDACTGTCNNTPTEPYTMVGCPSGQVDFKGCDSGGYWIFSCTATACNSGYTKTYASGSGCPYYYCNYTGTGGGTTVCSLEFTDYSDVRGTGYQTVCVCDGGMV